MKWLCCLLIIFSLSISNVYANDLEQQEYIIDKIEKLLKEKPDHWYVTNYIMFYCPDKERVDDASNSLYPEHTVYTEIVINFNLMRGDEEDSYVNFEKPNVGLLSGNDYKNQRKIFRRIDRIIKVELYKRLKKEVGWYVENLQEKPKEIKKEKSQEKLKVLRDKL